MYSAGEEFEKVINGDEEYFTCLANINVDEKEYLICENESGIKKVFFYDTNEEDLILLEEDEEDDDEDEGYISVSGWVIYRLGHIPEVGESFDYKNLHVTVTEADQRTVLQVKVTIQETETDKEDE